MNVTAIEWTATRHPDGTTTPGFSANPLKYRDRRTGAVVWGCVKRSAGCANCYSEALAKRYGRGGPFTRAEMEHLEPFMDEAELRKMLTAKTVGGVAVSGSRCFVGDMTDVFGEWVPFELLHRLFSVFVTRSDVTWQVLTKRPERMAQFFNGLGCPPNVWLGTSVENQAAADERIPHLLRTPAAVRFLSCEPLIGEVNLEAFTHTVSPGYFGDAFRAIHRPGTAEQIAALPPYPGVSWVIVGGESGSDSRHLRVEWVREIVAQCKTATVPVFVKQLGANVTTRLPDGEDWPNHACGTGPVQFSGDGFGNYHVRGLKDKKGGDPAEWPSDLRVREFPGVRA
jgi:protein gp37